MTAGSDPRRAAVTDQAKPSTSATSKLDVSPLLDSVTDLAMAVIGGRIEYINRSGLALLGFPSAEHIVGQKIEAVVDPRTVHALLVRRRDTGELDKGNWLRTSIKCANGSTAEVELLMAPMSGRDALAVVARRVDVTSVLDPNTPAAALHAAEGLKNLIANMAHELRTPLNAIIGFSEIIAQRMFGDINDRYAAYAGDIEASGQHLLRIINDILDYAKVESGEMALRLERVAVTEVVRASLRLISAQADHAGIEIIDELADLQPLLYVDQTKVKQIVVNLMSNAVKFTPRGGKVFIGSKLAGPEKVELWVRDTGIGMTEAEVADAVLPFRQPKRPPDGSYAGTGLGLPIAKALVALHGGEFYIKSTPKIGTEARFTLVCQEPTRPDGGLAGK
ncbi:MAG TPA: PAS domain-containing sensor histidine kinase [Alphaproteobacteria bacterium]